LPLYLRSMTPGKAGLICNAAHAEKEERRHLITGIDVGGHRPHAYAAGAEIVDAIRAAPRRSRVVHTQKMIRPRPSGTGHHCTGESISILAVNCTPIISERYMKMRCTAPAPVKIKDCV